MKKINFLITSIILTLCLSSKSHSFTNNDEFMNFKKSHEMICKKLNSPNLENIKKNWKVEKKNKYLQLFVNKIDGQILQIRSLFRSNQIQKRTFTYFKKPKIPFAEIRSDKNCNIQSIRKIIYNNKLIPQEVHSISTSIYKINNIKYLNPKLPNNPDPLKPAIEPVGPTLKPTACNIGIMNNILIASAIICCTSVLKKFLKSSNALLPSIKETAKSSANVSVAVLSVDINANKPVFSLKASSKFLCASASSSVVYIPNSRNLFNSFCFIFFSSTKNSSFVFPDAVSFSFNNRSVSKRV